MNRPLFAAPLLIGDLRTALLTAVLASVLPAPLRAHENPLPSATLVMRDGGHLVLTLQMDLARALHRTLQPEVSPRESLTQLSAMEPARFSTLWDRATRRWSQETGLVVQGRRHDAMKWTWPPARQAQQHLQHQLLPVLIGRHVDPERLSAQAEFRLPGPATVAIELRLPGALRPLMVTTMRPRPHWSGEGDLPISLNF